MPSVTIPNLVLYTVYNNNGSYVNVSDITTPLIVVTRLCLITTPWTSGVPPLDSPFSAVHMTAYASTGSIFCRCPAVPHQTAIIVYVTHNVPRYGHNVGMVCDIVCPKCGTYTLIGYKCPKCGTYMCHTMSHTLVTLWAQCGTYKKSACFG